MRGQEGDYTAQDWQWAAGFLGALADGLAPAMTRGGVVAQRPKFLTATGAAETFALVGQPGVQVGFDVGEVRVVTWILGGRQSGCSG